MVVTKLAASGETGSRSSMESSKSVSSNLAESFLMGDSGVCMADSKQRGGCSGERELEGPHSPEERGPGRLDFNKFFGCDPQVFI